jgi:hypothetical protein
VDEYFDGKFLEYINISNRFMGYYISQLEYCEYVRITVEEARVISNMELPDNKIYIVVRAIYSYPFIYGRYSIILNIKNELFIYYSALGSANVEFKECKDALLVSVDTIPNAFYVSWTVDG